MSSSEVIELLEELCEVERSLLEVHRQASRLCSSSLSASGAVERARRAVTAGEVADVVALVGAITRVQGEADAIASSSEGLERSLGRLPIRLVLP